MPLKTKFAGIKLDNPIVIAASPLTENIENIIKCAKAGAGAIITKSICNFSSSSYSDGYRRAFNNHRGLWMTSNFKRETLTLEEGKKLVSAALSKTKIPIIASVTAFDDQINSWEKTCSEMQDAGAAMIQLDLFYQKPFCSAKNIESLKILMKQLLQKIKIPIMPKLNITIPALMAAELFKNTGIKAVSYLDSIKVPPPIKIDDCGKLLFRFIDKPLGASQFGDFQFPLTKHYTYLLSQFQKFSLCAGGGIMNGDDVIEILMLGADAAQLATAILLNGYKHITKIIKTVEEFLVKNNYKNISEIKGLALNYIGNDEKNISFINAKAKISNTDCNQCGKCLAHAMCSAISKKDNLIEINQNLCDGCGFCVDNCSKRAIQLKKYV